MKIDRLPPLALLLTIMLAVAAAPLPVLAQDAEDEDEVDDRGHFYISAEAWMAQSGGEGLEPATKIDPSDPFNTQVQDFTYGTETEFRYVLGYRMKNNLGSIVGTYFNHDQDLATSGTSPGLFIWGQIQSHPLFAGFSNDGLADGYDASASTKLSDLRIDYARDAIRSKRVHATWFAGYRDIRYTRSQNTSYSALISGLPPLIPPYVTQPRPDLEPGPDTAYSKSDFSGSGIEAGMDFRMPLYKDRFGIEAGFNVAALRGKTDTSWGSTNSYYVLFGPDGSESVILTPPYDAFDEVGDDGPLVNRIAQETYQTGLKQNGRSTTAQILEAYLGLRWNAWKGLQVFGGFRSSRYDGVATSVRSTTAVDAYGLNVQGVEETSHSVTLDGFYVGLAYSF